MKNTKAFTKPKEELPGQVTGFSEHKCIENESITVTISMKDEYINRHNTSCLISINQAISIQKSSSMFYDRKQTLSTFKTV